VNTALEAVGINKRFGAVSAASNVNVSLGVNEVLGIIGANGAGKTTFLNIVTGYLKPDSGVIRYRDGFAVLHLVSRLGQLALASNAQGLRGEDTAPPGLQQVG